MAGDLVSPIDCPRRVGVIEFANSGSESRAMLADRSADTSGGCSKRATVELGMISLGYCPLTNIFLFNQGSRTEDDSGQVGKNQTITAFIVEDD